MSPRSVNPTPLDVIFIVFTSVTLLLLLLWIVTSLAGQTMFNDVPAWLQAMITSVWAKVSVAGGSFGVFLLRRYLDKSPAPNYLLWIPGFTIFLLLALFVVIRMLPPISRPSHAALRFAVDKKPDPSLTQKQIPDLVFWEQSPVEVPLHGLYPQSTTNPRYPYADVLNITPQRSSMAYIKLTVDSSQLTEAGPGYDYKICLDMAPSFPRGGTEPSILLACAKGICAPAQGEDLGYMVSCKPQPTGSNLFLPRALADEVNQGMRQAGWVVPSLDTLEKMTDRERVGFTRFDISFIPGGGVAGADHYYFMLQVNGQPVYIDGLLAERARYTLLATARNTISFALENLNFTGQYQGMEKLQVSVFFQQGDRLVRRQDLQRDYVALRDAPEVVLSTEAGDFRWKGTYVVPKNENKYEILLASSAQATLAMQAKARFDQDRLSFNSQPVVMVVRPPLREPPSYGLALGLVQPSSQVQFTFNAEEAKQLCRWATQQVGNGRGGRLIQPNLRRYEVATRGYSACP